jgi:hypothetical protein
MSRSKKTIADDGNEDYEPPASNRKRKAKHATISSNTSRKGRTRPKFSPSTGVQLLDLPREIRDMIWEFAVTSDTSITPVDDSEYEETIEDVAVHEPMQYNGLVDCRFLSTNKQMLIEASCALVRNNKVRLQLGMTTPKAHLKRRLTYILQHATFLRLEIPLVNRQAWYLGILTGRKDIDTLVIAVKDRGGDFVFRWDEEDEDEEDEDEEDAKEDLRVFGAIKVREKAEMSYKSEWGHDIGGYWRGEYRGWAEDIDAEVQDFLDVEVVPMMKGKS